MEFAERLHPTRFKLPGREDPVYIATERWALEPWEGEDEPELPQTWHTPVPTPVHPRPRQATPPVGPRGTDPPSHRRGQ